MNTISKRSCLVVGLLSLAAASTAQAQQTFEDRYVAARPNQSELVSLPTFGVVPTAAAPLETDVAAQLTEAIQKELASTAESRFEVLTRPSGTKVSWAFVVRNAPRANHDAFTPQFTDQLIRCLHSVESGTELAALTLLLVGNLLSDEERAQANAAAAEAFANWQDDECVTRRNNVAFFEQNRARLTAATRGMLTDLFDPLLFRGQNLLDLIQALYPIYFGQGGFWTTELSPRLRAVFESGVADGLLTAAQTTAMADRELITFWDWVLLVVTTKPELVRTFIEHTASGCVRTVADLSRPFKFSRCVSDNQIRVVSLRVAGQTYSTVQRQVQP